MEWVYVILTVLVVLALFHFVDRWQSRRAWRKATEEAHKIMNERRYGDRR